MDAQPFNNSPWTFSAQRCACWTEFRGLSFAKLKNYAFMSRRYLVKNSDESLYFQIVGAQRSVVDQSLRL